MFIFCYALLECQLYEGRDHSVLFTAVSPAPKDSVWQVLDAQ